MGLLFCKTSPKVVFVMQIYESLCACAIIAAASGTLCRACARLFIRPFALAYAGAVLLLLGRFSIVPLAEFRCNAAALFFPAYFLIQAVDCRRQNPQEASTWRALFVAALLPLGWMLAAALVELLQADYAAVNLGAVALRNAQAVLCALVFCSMLLRASLRARRRPA